MIVIIIITTIKIDQSYELEGRLGFGEREGVFERSAALSALAVHIS
jgi:hypothetical protein